MTYDDNRNRNGMRDETSYTGWIIGGVVVLALIIGVFALTNRTNDHTAANNSPATTTGSAPSTTSAASPNAPAANVPTPPAKPVAPAR
jgi:hypothetical protein